MKKVFNKNIYKFEIEVLPWKLLLTFKSQNQCLKFNLI